jgi:hypothetical protein
MTNAYAVPEIKTENSRRLRSRWKTEATVRLFCLRLDNLRKVGVVKLRVWKQ